jgi:hypothetical protein
MKRILAVLVLTLIGLQAVEPAFASHVRVVRRGPYTRTTVVVHRGWPLRRPARVVYVRPAPRVVRVHSAVFLPSVVFAGTVVTTRSASRHAIVWEDSQILSREEGWAEVMLNADSRGRELWLEITRGKAQFDWAEVVFENGEARVVDFRERTHGPGLYSLLDFSDGRRVDHVRLVARAKTPEAKIVLRMEK